MKTYDFHKVLVANRGEIARRIIRAIRELDIMAVVIHSESDRELPFVTEADEAYSLGAGSLADTYMNSGRIIELALEAGVDAIHPGYGFLAENADFAKACRLNGIQFIGPDEDVISLMGHKANAKKKAKELGLSVLEGKTGHLDDLIEARGQLPYPVLIKPSAGGGGKGMRVVHSPETFETAAREASREAIKYFGSGDLYVEPYLDGARHIEVQIIADKHGNSIHLFERECSLQRRYQKIIEEAPSSFISEHTRELITSTALDLVKGIGYVSAGTVEFLMDSTQEFHFLEMNTRIQVEHPVTEMITGVDLVKEQIRIAEGHALSFNQEQITMEGHAIEARIYAEDPEKDFLPSTGRIETLEIPVRKGSRVDSGFGQGNLVEAWYDPMLAKVIVRAGNREEARNLLIQTLKELRITGLHTNRDFLIELLRSAYFSQNMVHTRLIDNELDSIIEACRRNRNARDKDLLLAAATLIALQNHQEPDHPGSVWHTIGHWRILPELSIIYDQEPHRIRYELNKGRKRLKLHLAERDYQLTLEKRANNEYWIRINTHILLIWGIAVRSEILLDLDGVLFRLRRADILDERYFYSDRVEEQEGQGPLRAPLNGRIVQINVQKGDQVKKGDTLMVIESMKMENKILTAQKATVNDIMVSVGDQVQNNQVIITLESL